MKRPSRCVVPLLGLVLGLGVSATGLAQEPAQDSLRGIPVVVELKGKRRHGADRLSRTLRRTLADALGGLRSSRALHREQVRLQMPVKERTKPSKLAEGARGIAADYLVFVRVQRKARARYQAKGYVIDAANGRIVHKHTEPYRRPSKEAGPAGELLAQSVLDALRRIQAEKAPPPPIASQLPEPQIATPPPTAPPATVTAPPPPIASAPPPPAAVEPPVTAAPPPPAATEPPVTSPPPPTAVTAPPAPRKRGAFELRLGIGGGAGLLRSYQVSSDAVSVSDLSHTLSPQGLGRLGLELSLPTIGLGLVVQGSLRPVGYQVVIDQQPQDLSGMLIDGRAALRYHIELADRGGLPVELIPAVGLRLGHSSIEAHPGDVIPNATMLAIFGRLAARIPYDNALELEAGADFGAVASYSETPVQTGNSPSGFVFGADLALRYWVGELVGVSVDTRFNFDRISFAERPTRAVTRDEQAGLVDANVTITDVRTSLSLVFRI